ncbi:MAG: zinc metalloprotease HtpX [Firmicutes bacterium]|uniref:Protease HtpX homolog n=1 Tax=Candidatus Gallilactobacillus intestinavium TaxID=2840838 RepID=A0A9D9E635_9LACO|nr:zinc metalloprotease HtpX [Candidatus Gallilactobacillus intestinavium]
MLYQQINQNKRRTFYVLLFFFILTSLVGGAIGYLFAHNFIIGVIAALIITLIYSIISINNSIDTIMKLNSAHEITNINDDRYKELKNVISDMALVARIPIPRIFIINDDSPNAFATGNNPNNSAIAVTSGLLNIMNRDELEGVIGHEVSHIRNYDIRLQTISLALTSAISLLVNFGSQFLWNLGFDEDNNDSSNNLFIIFISIILIILGPLASTIAQMALSRNREFLADAGSVELTRNPQELINALKKLDKTEPMKKVNSSSSALYISDPIKKDSWWNHLFDTHPSISKRIKRLENM